MGNSVGEGIWDNHPVVKADAKRAAKNKALANSAKGKTQTPTADAARRAANKETPTGSVKILKRSSSQGLTEIARANANKIMNEAQTKITNDAKSGAAAKRGASMVRTGKPNETVKIRTSGLQGRGGALGGIHMGGSGMNWETK